MSIIILLNKPVNMSLLIKEMAEAGFTQTILTDDWLTIFDATDQDETAVKNVFLAHTGDPSSDELRSAGARALAKSVPNWSTWAIPELQAWYDTNISPTQINAEATLADAKVIQIKQSAAILALGKMVIAIRNQLWPDLPGD